jgi:oligopeptidase A
MKLNPLLEVKFQIPFHEISADDVEPAFAELLRDARENLEAIAADQGARTYESTMLAMESMTERLDYAMVVVRHLTGVRTTPELRAAFNAVEAAVSEFYSSIPLHTGLWNQVKAFSMTEEGMNLVGARKRFLAKTLESFRRHGADLGSDDKARLGALDVELAKVTTKFGDNVLDSTNEFEVVITDEVGLAGLPEAAIAAARQSAAGKGLDGWRFTLQGPSYVALMTYLDDAAVREKVFLAYASRAAKDPFDNRELLARILELRREKAALLGFPNFADFVLDDRMARRGSKALEFLRDLKDKVSGYFERENADLREFAGRNLEPWDVAYFAEKERQALYDFDEEELRPYFPAERVVSGMFEIVRLLFGISLNEKEGVPVWHPDVKFYEIRDESGVLVGAFYADWFPREDKRGGAWMDGLLTGKRGPGVCEPHLGVMCGSLSEPVGGRPALLTHREVETIFHEFGHLLHHCLSRVEVKSLSGTNVAWDFVELPSQIMENWCWEREALDVFARHFETGAAIPQELFDKMIRARNFRSANVQMRQLGFGILDLSLHTEYSPLRDGDVISYSRSILQEFSVAELPSDYAMVASFTHLFAHPVGYGAGYYSYKWAEVLDADAFTRFKREGIFSRIVGQSYVDHILGMGNSEDPAELYRRFMGRDPDPEALLRRSGLEKMVTIVESES